MIIEEALKYGQEIVGYLDARILLGHALLMSHEEIIINSKSQVKEEIFKKYESFLSRRKKLEPIAYIINSKEFFSREFYINNHVLIPRPDTEILVDTIKKLDGPKKILDLGCGSGCIIISLLLEIKGSCGVGVDISREALLVASVNCKIYNLKNRLNLIKSNWFDSLKNQKFDIIVSNPPYIDFYDERVALETRLYEPEISLYSGKKGLESYEIIACHAYKYLEYDGKIFLEIGKDQEKDIIEIFKNNGFVCESMVKDLGGIIRCLEFRYA